MEDDDDSGGAVLLHHLAPVFILLSLPRHMIGRRRYIPWFELLISIHPSTLDTCIMRVCMTKRGTYPLFNIVCVIGGGVGVKYD